MSAELLQTKFNIPPARANLVARPQLVKRLDKGLTRKLILLSAPAGWGRSPSCYSLNCLGSLFGCWRCCSVACMPWRNSSSPGPGRNCSRIMANRIGWALVPPPAHLPKVSSKTQLDRTLLRERIPDINPTGNLREVWSWQFRTFSLYAKTA